MWFGSATTTTDRRRNDVRARPGESAMRVLISLIAICLALSCRDGERPDSGTFDSGIHDAEVREGGVEDALPDADVNLDGGNRDLGARDVPLLDGGDGILCEQPIAWNQIELPLIATTSASIHRERFECAGVGGAAT